jgi:spermidine synthase
VVAFSDKYLGSINNGAFRDPRVDTVFTDGRAWVEKHKKSYDVIIMDMTDPFGPSKMLYTREFFRRVKLALKDDRGLFVMHSESPISRPVAFNCINKTLGAVFSNVTPFYTYIQMYATLWSIVVCSPITNCATLKEKTIDMRLDKRGIKNLKLYTGAAHRAMATPYPYIEEILAKKTRIITDRKPDFPDHFYDKGEKIEPGSGTEAP